MSRFLIAGGAGFVGSPLSRALAGEGHDVVVLDDLRSGAREPDDPRIKFINGDIRDSRMIDDVFEEFRPTIVVHLAALHYIPYCNAHPDETIDINVAGTQRITDACTVHKPERVFFASTAAVYRPSDRPHQEEDPVQPIDIYGLTKAFCEEVLQRFHRDSSVPVVIGRLFNVYGPGDPNRHVVPEVVEQLAAAPQDADPVHLELGTLTTRRDYIHVSDAVAAIVATTALSAPGCEIMNIGSGKTASVSELVEFVEAILGREIIVETDPTRIRKVDRPTLQSDPSKLVDRTGWRPEVGLEQGLEELIRLAGRA